MHRVVSLALFLFLLVSLSAPSFAETKGAADSVALWDTGRHFEESLSPEQVAKRDGWKQITDENATITGDVCLSNDYLSLVLRKGAREAEGYYRLGDQMAKALTLVPVGADGDRAKAINSFRLVDHTQDSFLLEAGFVTQSGKTVGARYLLKRGKPFVETRPGQGTEEIRVEMQSRHAVIPDLFGADVVVSAKDTKASELRLPSENMLLNLIDNGNAIIQCVWRSGDQKVGIRLEGTGEDRAISAVEIGYKKDMDMNVWVGVLAAPAIWCQKKAGELNAVKYTKLDWKVPFRALWRADYRRTDGLIDTWKVVLKKQKEGEWEGFGIRLKKDGSVEYHESRGVFGYPACIDRDAAYLRVPKFEPFPNLKYAPDGTIVMYPFQKIEGGPKNVYGAVEVLKEALEDTPEFTRPDEIAVKLSPRFRYPGVCGTTGAVEKIFDEKQEQAKKREIIERLDKMNFFIVVVRMRVVEYMDWCKRMRRFCAEAKAARPGLVPLADEMDGRLAEFDKTYTELKLAERTPAAAHVLTDKWIALVDNTKLTEDKKNEAAKQLGRDLRTIGGRQDHSTGVFRMITKEMRQRAGDCMMEAKDDASFNFAQEIRRRTLEMLQNTLGVENRGFD
jgi:hypothetical protein